MTKPYRREIKVEHFKNLVAVALADNYLDSKEMEFLAEKAQEYGIPEEEVNNIIKNAGLLEFKIPVSDMDKEDQLADIVFMAMIDGEVHETEYALCISVAEKLGLNKSDVDKVIELVNNLWG